MTEGEVSAHPSLMPDRDNPQGSAIGAALRAAREARGLDIAAIAAQLRIRPVFLEAIEAGRFAELPGAAYAIGFVRAYADCLGLDGAEAAAAYRDELGRGDRRFSLAWPKRQKDHKPFPGFALLIVSLVIGTALYGLWNRVGEESSPAGGIVPVPPSIKEAAEAPPPATPAPLPAPVSLPTPSPAPSPATPAPSSPSAPQASPAPSSSAPAQLPQLPTPESALTSSPAEASPSIATEPTSSVPPALPAEAGAPQPPPLRLRADLDSWIEIRNANGDLILQKILRAGEIYDPAPDAGLILDTGNAGGLVIEIAGKALPQLGPVGIIRRGIPLDPKRLIAP